MKILCTICARKGSKGLKNKNIKKINGKHLIYYTINQAIKSKIFDEIVVSSDSRMILDLSNKYGIQNLIFRNKKLAKDNSPKVPVIRNCLEEIEKLKNKKFDTIIDLDVTAPLRKISDIKNALLKFKKEKAVNLFSACNSRKNPYFNVVAWKNGKIKPVINLMKKLTSRQQAPNVYDMNASIYIWQRKTLINYDTIFLDKTSMYLMPEERSIDIDNQFDFKVVSKFLK
jgi:CMP-N,N'-diacetyllegionaminic acid synthase